MLTFEDILRNEALEKVRREMGDEIRRQVQHEMGDEIMEKARRAVQEEIRCQVRREMGDEIRRQARDEVRREVQDEVRDEAQRELLLGLLTERFGALPAAVTLLVARGTRDELTRWSKRILAATSLDDVFATS